MKSFQFKLTDLLLRLHGQRTQHGQKMQLRMPQQTATRISSPLAAGTNTGAQRATASDTEP